MAAAGFLSHYLSGPLPYVQRHITVKENVLSASLNKTFPSFLPLFASACVFHSNCLSLTLCVLVQWVIGSILHGVDPLSYFSFQPVFHNWCNKGHGMCYPLCGMVHIKEPLLLIEKSIPCGSSSVFPLSLSEWSSTICLMPYNRK